MTRVSSIHFPDVLLIEGRRFSDERGAFTELFRQPQWADWGIGVGFVQDNASLSKQGVIRGMHFQSGKMGQAKLITCLSGEIYDVFVDIRPESPTFGKWGSYILMAERGDQLFIPRGYAHGFACLSEEALVVYKVSSVYNPKTEMGFSFSDPEVGIQWPISQPLLSKRDQGARSLREVIANENLDLGSGGAPR